MKYTNKYQKNTRIHRNCEECQKYGGMLSKHYFLCLAEVYEYQERVATRNIYDIKVKNKGYCTSFKPKEVTNDLLLNYVTMDSNFEENATDLHNEE